MNANRWRPFLQIFTTLLIGITILVAAFIWWRWVNSDGGFEAWYVAITVVLAGLWWLNRRLVQKPKGTTQATSVTSLTNQTATQQNRNRQNYLNALTTTKIDPVLYQSLHGEVIQLTMSEANEGALARTAHQRSWQMVKQEAGQADEAVPLDKPVGDLFNECGRGLLILGAPGSGKTFTLMHLAEQLVTEASLPGQPMPMGLNLASWAQNKADFRDWLAEEIFVQYSVGRELARQWIASNQLIYLLDGLDEVAASARDDCITAINNFRANQQGTVEMAVCSRTKDYHKLKARLNLNSAIQIQPLNDEKVDTYLCHPKLALQAVRSMLRHDPPLRELTRSPLLLSVMTLAYRGKAKAELQQLNSSAARRTHLFDTYIEAMFAHRPCRNRVLTVKKMPAIG
ncbi:NACHT domain-containing protein [Candidatus Leptofilum sp.]|uniref:NACHT domain-containing protein n=1 Tax=Candidatus Leptofilum sp. TaxID=3241576 RepID=UPI003B5B8B47